MVKEKISSSQLVLLIIPMIIATEFMSVPGVIYQFAKEDDWLSYLLSLITGVWAILVFTTLASRHPGMTFPEYLEKIMGKWLGKAVSMFYMYYLFLYVTTISDEVMSFITLFAQPKTPRMVTLGLFVAVCGIGAWLGIEVLARCSELLIPLSIIFSVVIAALLLPEMVPNFLTPVFGRGIVPILQGAVVPSGWAGEFFLLGFLLPYLNDPSKARAFSFTGLLAVALIMMLVIVVSTTVNGPLTGQLKYAYYNAVRYLSIGEFLERIDPVIVGVWVYNGFLKTALFLWAFVLCIAQVFGVVKYRFLALPVTLLSIVGCLWAFSNAVDLSNFLTFTFPTESLVTQDIIPTLILGVDLIRSRKREKYAKVVA